MRAARGHGAALLALAASGALAGCAAGEDGTGESALPFAPEYRGVKTDLLDGDLVNFHVSMTGARGSADIARYAECAAAQYALIRGYGFARHVRTNIADEGGIWRADAVYTISPALPRGLKTIDAEVVAADCAENGIPMV
ncbi:hypothetical protein ACEWPL_008980 [Roseovarius sp. S1116L3]|uniref:hypothetical protein n=1 Tax=Roseovarius roseus TaxID=3342636 RepID=UPI00372C2EEE